TTSVLPESTNTTLSDPAHLQTFNEVTSKIRCICLPSLPIKSCSFNNCRVSAYLKQFFENRIRKGENSETIIAKTQNGFGDEIFSDPTVQKFLKEGNEDIVNGLVRGFGPRILADPDPTQINFTLLFFIISGLILIFVYLKKIRQKKDQQQVPVDDQAKESLRNEYIRELDEK
ncbi:MAG: cytochrome c-type biogenesis protein CcmH, partial [Leptospira sp.]|nr:cytochrome c-type biogenesis protein CcmH [Leptospira sp.]